MRVYTVLAGLMVWEAYDCHVNVCEGLDWKRTFALHLWYHCQPSAPFRDALEEYVQAFQVGEESQLRGIVGRGVRGGLASWVGGKKHVGILGRRVRGRWHSG